MRKTILALCFMAACSSSDPKKDRTIAIRMGVTEYLAAAEKADATKTHASGDYLIASQAKDKHANDLVAIAHKDGKDAVLAEIATARTLMQQEREAVQQKVNRLQVVGRGHSPEEKEWLSNGAPQEIQKIEFRLSALDELESKIK